MMGALAFVHLGDVEVEQCWRRMKPLLPAEMSEFAEYYERTWIGTSTIPPI